VRAAVILASLAALAVAGCGGAKKAAASGTSHTVLEVSKAFSDAGIAFTGLVTGNPYVRGQQPFLPGKLNTSDLRYDVAAELSGSDTPTHTGVVVWVFDTDAHARQAIAQVPLATWGQGPRHITRAVLGNVIVVASGFTGLPKQKLDRALAALR
jgi:hypothetical protein